MLGMGLTIDVNELKALLKTPKWIFTIVPTIFGNAFSFNFNCLIFSIFLKKLHLGFIILGSCPGGTASNVIAYICGANLSLSIFCTFASTIMAVILTPLLIYLLSDENISINTIGLIKSTFFIVFIPVLFGLFLKFILKIKSEIFKIFSIFF